MEIAAFKANSFVWLYLLTAYIHACHMKRTYAHKSYILLYFTQNRLLYQTAVLECLHRFSFITREMRSIMGRARADMTVSTRLSDSVFTETHGLENAVESEYE